MCERDGERWVPRDKRVKSIWSALRIFVENMKRRGRGKGRSGKEDGFCKVWRWVSCFTRSLLSCPGITSRESEKSEDLFFVCWAAILVFSSMVSLIMRCFRCLLVNSGGLGSKKSSLTMCCAGCGGDRSSIFSATASKSNSRKY